MRQYNAMDQLTRLTTTGASDGVDFEYRYSPNQNNGKIVQMKDWISGEEVTYTYDALQRLAMKMKLIVCLFLLATQAMVVQSAETIAGSWVGTFGDLTAKGVIQKHFRLSINSSGRRWDGFLDSKDINPVRQKLSNAGWFDQRLCFDVFDRREGTDMRWCVHTEGHGLVGVWSLGPQGGPLLGGMGVGARLYNVKGHRAE